MYIQFLGATQKVSGSKYLLQVASKKNLVDCGLFQDRKNLRPRDWQQMPLNLKDIDYILFTFGYIPLLVKNGFTGANYCPRAILSLYEILYPYVSH